MNEKLLTDEELCFLKVEKYTGQVKEYRPEIVDFIKEVCKAQLSKAEPIIRKEVVAAVVKWGNESCEEHAESRARRVYLKRKVIRAECPQCRAFLEQEAREEKGK